MYGLDMINTSVLGALGCDMNTFLRYFPAAETMYSLLVALAIGLILLGWVWNLFKNYGLGLGVDAEDPVKLTAKAILFIVLAYYADEIVNNSKTKILLNLEEEEAQRVQGVLHLSEAELMEITHFERGSALISTNNNNIAVEIKCSQMEKELITTDRRELAELAQRAAPKQHPC